MPCGRILGHNERCSEGYECYSCKEHKRLEFELGRRKVCLLNCEIVIREMTERFYALHEHELTASGDAAMMLIKETLAAFVEPKRVSRLCSFPSCSAIVVSEVDAPVRCARHSEDTP